MATNEETNAAGTDTRPPMLVENDYESWKIRIHRYFPETSSTIKSNKHCKEILENVEMLKLRIACEMDLEDYSVTFQLTMNTISLSTTFQAPIGIANSYGFQKQFPTLQHQLRGSSTQGTHALVHDGQSVTELIQREGAQVEKDMLLGSVKTQEKGWTLRTSRYSFFMMEAKEK
ncbi:hypothetical protein Tco_1199565 [Tanacetum coccineum]